MQILKFVSSLTEMVWE